MPSFVKYGSSAAVDAAQAVDEALTGIDLSETRFVLAFVPRHLDLVDLSDALNGVLHGVPAFGCTTAGQIGGGGYDVDSLLIIAFPKAHFRCASILLENLQDLTVGDIASETERQSKLFLNTAGWNRLALLFSDGLSKREDILASTLDTVLGDVPIFGGSAGDGLQFGETFVLHKGRFHSNAAVLLLLETSLHFEGLNFDHFTPTETQLVITKADPEKRVVYEINGAPAATEYARLIGCRVDELSPETFAENPMLVLFKSTHYVRAIQYVVEENALSFMAAIDDGLIMSLGRGKAVVETLHAGLNLRRENGREPDFILGFDCVLRKLEFESKNLSDTTSEILNEHRVLGFNTYGEQHGGVHINQTFVGVAFFEPGERIQF